MNKLPKKNLIIAVVIIVALIILFLPVASKEINYQDRYNKTGSELVGDLKIGQTFFSIDKNLNRISILLLNYKDRPNDKDIIFHLREEGKENDFKTVIVNASKIKDNFFHNFDFKAIPDSFGKQYYFFIESPSSYSNNAITYRFTEGSVYDSGDLYINQVKQNSDLAFTASYKESLIAVLKNEVFKSPLIFSIIILFIAAFSLLLCCLFKKKIFEKKIYLILIILAIGIILRLIYANYLPLTRDEGAYLYDGFLIKEGFTPFKDFFTRSPVLIYTLSLFVSVLGKTIFAGRFLSILSSLLSALFLYLIGKELFGKKVGKWALFLFLVAPSIILQTTYNHTQPFLILLTLIATYFFVKSAPKEKKNLFLLLSGVFLGLSVLIRHSAVLYLVWEIVLILFVFKEALKEKIKNSIFLILGSIVSALPILTYLIIKTGFSKIWLTLGPGLLFRLGASGDDSGGFLNIWQTQKIPALFLISEESLFIIFMGIFFLMPFFSQFLKRGPKLSKIITLATSLIFFGFLYVGARKMGERNEFSTSAFIIPLLAAIWIIMATKLLNFSKALKIKEEKLGFLIPIIFVITPLFSYGFWTKFHPNYFSEFLIGFSLCAAIFISSLKTKIMPFALKTIFSVLVLSTISFSVIFALTLPHTGSFEIKALKEAKKFFAKNAHREDEVFTSAVIIPFLSNNKVPLNVSHPTIYKYSWISDDIIKKLGPTLTDIQNYLEEKKVKWVIVESTTRSDYFVGHDDFHKYINSHYQLKKTIDNQIRKESVPIDIYERISNY